jgi:hypothetical protein
MSGSPKQDDAQIGFQFFDVVAYRALRAPAMARSLRHAAEPGDAIENMDRIDIADSDHSRPFRLLFLQDRIIEKLNI